MSTQGYATLLCQPQPLIWSGGGTSTFLISVAMAIDVVWADSNTDTYAAGIPVLSIYDSTTALDGSLYVHPIFVVHGTPNLWAMHESDIANIAARVDTFAGGGEYAVLWRADGDQVYRIPQF